MVIRLRKSCLALTLAAAWGYSESASAVTVQEALGPVPTQKDVDFDRPAPAEIEKCKVGSEKIDGKTGLVLRNGNGQILRSFVDTNSDNSIDQWSYFKNGVEVYRDIDSNANKRPDQFRWLNTAGTRWGIDKNEDGKIDIWKIISAEEATAEVVAAIASQDPRRFGCLVMTPAEIRSAGIGSARAEEMTKKSEKAVADFAKLVAEKKLLTPESKWVYFGGGRPSMIPASGDSTGDLVVYENVSAMVDKAGTAGQLDIGTLVRVGDAWRVIDVPTALTGGTGYTFLPASDKDEQPEATGNQPNQVVLQKLKELEELDQKIASATPDEQGKLNEQRVEIIEALATSAEGDDRAMWYRLLAESVLAAVQTNSYPDGVDRLKKVAEGLEANPDDAALAACVQYRLIHAKNYLAQQGGNFAKAQADFLAEMEKFIADNPQCEEAPDGLMHLAQAYEFAGNDSKATQAYEQIVAQFPKSTVFASAKGAKTRLESLGKVLNIQGREFGAAKNISLNDAAYKNKVVLVHYWSSDVDLCKVEIPQLRDLAAKYANNGFAVLSISLDRDPATLRSYLASTRIPGKLIYEPGGISSRLATEMGIYTVPTMLLVDKQGRVINRDIHAAELDSELRKIFDAEPRQAKRP